MRRPYRPHEWMHVSVTNRQRGVKIDRAFLLRLAQVAVSLCLEHPARAGAPLQILDGVEVTLLTDREIARVNKEFLDHNGPTDVITFDHGEILVSAETARDNARRFRRSVDEEVALYIVHGLLHLNGWSDKTSSGARKMRTLQEKLLKQSL